MEPSVSLIVCVCFRLFGHTGACSACGQSIPPSEMVMRAQGNVYHLKVRTTEASSAGIASENKPFPHLTSCLFCERVYDAAGAKVCGCNQAYTNTDGNGYQV